MHRSLLDQMRTSDSFIGYNSHLLPYKNKIVKMINVLVSTAVRNSGKCNLTGHVDCYDCMVTSIEEYIAYIAIINHMILVCQYYHKANIVLLQL